MIKFPQSFFWGAATSSYQVEGNNVNSDWWRWEKEKGIERSGAACLHYEYYKKDFDLAAGLNHNCHRLSIEWSRIEPERGKFIEKEIEHYRQVILALKERGLTPIVTLHHFSNPVWFADLGGWQNRDSVKYFLNFIEKIVPVLCDQVKFWVTINEPLVYVYHSYILGVWPPQEESFLKAKRVEDHLITAHIKAYNLIHKLYRDRGASLPQVSIAKNMQAFYPCGFSFRNKLSAYLRNKLYNFAFLNKLIRHKSLDYIGINYYTRSLVDVRGCKMKNLLLDTCVNNHSRLKKNSLGWDIYPQGLLDLLIRLKRYKLPIFILENGICTEEDKERWAFIHSHLEKVSLAMMQGVEVLGYIYWSLIDNFEWDKGFTPRFGLIEVDYRTLQRNIRESARKYAVVCKTGILEP